MAKNKTVIIDDSIMAPVKGSKAVEATPSTESPSKRKSQKASAERVRGKKYIEAKAKVDVEKTYTPEEAVRLAKETSISKFGGSVQLHVVLKKGSVNKTLELPHSSGKTKKVEIASDETIEKLKSGKIDFDVLITHPSMMPKLVPFAKVLGPKGLMPNPKNGTISEAPEKAAEKFGGNSFQVKTENKAPLVHTIIGKLAQPEKELVENYMAILEAVGGSRIVDKAYIAPTMGPSIKVIVS